MVINVLALNFEIGFRCIKERMVHSESLNLLMTIHTSWNF